MFETTMGQVAMVGNRRIPGSGMLSWHTAH